MEMAYVQARVSAFTDAEALRESGVARSTFYDWPKERREYLRSLALGRRRDIAVRAQEVLEENAVAAAQVKVKGLKSRRENIAQAAAGDILDRVLGKATQRREVSGVAGGPIEHKDVTDLTDEEAGRRPLALLERGGAESLG